MLVDIDRLALPVFVRVTKAFRIDVLPLTPLKTHENLLKLQEHIVILLLIVVIWVFDAQHWLSEPIVHEKLLDQTDHVADAAEIFDANIASGALVFVEMLDAPVIDFVSAPTGMLIEFIHESKHLIKVWQAVSAQNSQQFEGRASSHLLIQFRRHHFLALRLWILEKILVQ